MRRYDLLCLEGLARALRIFLGTEPVPDFKVLDVKEPLEMTVKPEVRRGGERGSEVSVGEVVCRLCTAEEEGQGRGERRRNPVLEFKVWQVNEPLVVTMKSGGKGRG